jgi:hypothetical protein
VGIASKTYAGGTQLPLSSVQQRVVTSNGLETRPTGRGKKITRVANNKSYEGIGAVN